MQISWGCIRVYRWHKYWKLKDTRIVFICLFV